MTVALHLFSPHYPLLTPSYQWWLSRHFPFRRTSPYSSYSGFLLSVRQFHSLALEHPYIRSPNNPIKAKYKCAKRRIYGDNLGRSGRLRTGSHEDWKKVYRSSGSLPTRHNPAMNISSTVPSHPCSFSSMPVRVYDQKSYQKII